MVHIICIFVLVSAAGTAAERIPAFPGAEGAGMYATGGRGGTLYRVANLSAKGPGSLADAVSQPNRTIVFAVSGTIDLRGGKIAIRQPNITIAGQTAPGEGICIKNGSLQVLASNVIVRHLRIRRGFIREGNNGDAMNIKGEELHDIIADHVSTSWATDENLTLTNAQDVTMQYSISAEALDYFNPEQSPTRHAFGSLFGSSTDGGKMTIHHSLYAHNRLRNARTTGSNEGGLPVLDFRNNVIYDAKELTSHSGTQPITGNWVGNTIKDGPSSGIEGHEKSILFTFMSDGPYKMYASGNYIFGKPDWTADNWLAIRYQKSGENLKQKDIRAESPLPTPTVTTHAALDAYEDVLANAGATLPSRDAVDLRIVRDVRNGTGAVLNYETDLSPAARWQTYYSLDSPKDTDGDGVPDAWEDQFGLDKKNPSDASKLAHNGYSNLEHYLNNTDPTGGVMPIVFVSASISRAWRGNGEAGEFRFSRTGSVSDALTIRYNADSTVTIPAGSRSAVVAVPPASSSMVVVHIAAADNYHRGLPAQALVRIEEGTLPPPVNIADIDPQGNATPEKKAAAKKNLDDHKVWKKEVGKGRKNK